MVIGGECQGYVKVPSVSGIMKRSFLSLLKFLTIGVFGRENKMKVPVFDRASKAFCSPGFSKTKTTLTGTQPAVGSS